MAVNCEEVRCAAGAALASVRCCEVCHDLDGEIKAEEGPEGGCLYPYEEARICCSLADLLLAFETD